MKRKSLLSILITIVLCVGMFAFLSGSTSSCDMESPPASQSSYDQGAKATEESVRGIVSNDTLPTITRSLDRENIKKRLEFLNQPNRIGYLYCFSDNGVLIKEVQVLGKVTSLNSYLTPMEEVKTIGNLDLGEYSGDQVVTVQAPDLDGTYGENVGGVFWFTPDGVYQEWTGFTFYSAERMSFTTPPLLIEQVK